MQKNKRNIMIMLKIQNQENLGKKQLEKDVKTCTTLEHRKRRVK